MATKKPAVPEGPAAKKAPASLGSVAASPAPFDPWTATLQDVLDRFAGDVGISAEHWRCVVALNMRSRSESILSSGGRGILDAVAECARCGLPLPRWLADAYLERWNVVRSFRAGSWDDAEAFGPTHPEFPRALKRGQLDAKNSRMRAQPLIDALFDPRRPNPLPRNAKGYLEAARRLNISVKQVKSWITRTRSNRRGARHDSAAELSDTGIRWHAPFGTKDPQTDD